MVDMTLNDVQTKVKVIHFGSNRFFITTSNRPSKACSRMHRLATIHSYKQTIDDRRTQHSNISA